MDPDMALAQIRSHIDGYERATTKGEARRHADDLIEHMRALDAWLSMEGFLPTPWQRATPQPPEPCKDCDGRGIIGGTPCASCD